MESAEEKINKLLLNLSFRNWALNCDAKDYEQWENVFQSNEALRELAYEAKEIIIEVELSEINIGVEDQKSFERLLEKRRNLIGPPSLDEPDFQIKSRKSRFAYLIKIAAVLSFIVVFSGVLYFNVYRKADEPIQTVVEIIKKQTQSGQHLTVTLPDGSKVKLNSNSRISYPKNFFKNRMITLEGEAFFSVVRNESSPFIVKTKSFQTEVLGTLFNVNAYSWSENKVSVLEGKVKVTAFSSALDQGFKVLEKKEAVEIVNSEFRDADFNLDEILWKDGFLVFRNENIQSISAKIERWFGVTVIVKNQSAIAGNFKGKYANESLDEILVGMGFALNFSHEMKENQIIITGKNN
jgi:transmembrane sensor